MTSKWSPYVFNIGSIWIQFGFRVGLKMDSIGPKMDSKLIQYGVSTSLIWFEYGFNLVPILVQYVCNMVPMWRTKYGFIVGPSWIQFEPTMTSALIHWCFKLNSIWFKYELILASMWIQYGFNWDWRFPVEFNADSIQI